MSATINVHDIFSQVKKLDIEDQLNLIEKIVILLKKTQSSSVAEVRLSSISSVGGEVWKGIDIDKYVEGERQW